MYEINVIKTMRRQLDITQKELARQSGVSQSMIAKIESGRMDPSYTNAKKIFDALKILEAKHDTLASEIMTKKIYSVLPEEKLKSVVSKMKKYEISQLPVIDKKNCIGYVSEASLLEHLGDDKNEPIVKDVMKDSPPIVPLDTPSDIIGGLLSHFPLVLVAKHDKLKGIITKSDLLKVVYLR